MNWEFRSKTPQGDARSMAGGSSGGDSHRQPGRGSGRRWGSTFDCPHGASLRGSVGNRPAEPASTPTSDGHQREGRRAIWRQVVRAGLGYPLRDRRRPKSLVASRVARYEQRGTNNSSSEPFDGSGLHPAYGEVAGVPEMQKYRVAFTLPGRRRTIFRLGAWQVSSSSSLERQPANGRRHCRYRCPGRKAADRSSAENRPSSVPGSPRILPGQ